MADLKLQNRVTLLLCTAAALFEGFDNQSMGVAAPRLVSEFSLTAGQTSIIFSATTLGLFVGAALGGRVADFVGRKRTLAFSMLLFGLFTLLTAVAIGLKSLFLARVLTGLGLGGAMPNFIALSSEAAHPDRRLRSVTAVMAAMPLGGAVAGLMALGASLGWGWRAIFYVGGAGPVLLALALAKGLGAEKFGDGPHVDGKVVTGGSLASPEGVATVLFGPGRTATTLQLWAGFFFTQLVLLLMLNWLPSLCVGLGFSRAQASWASICFNLSGSLGAIALSRLHSGARRRVWTVVTYAGMALALALLPVMGKFFLLTALASGLAGVFIVGAQLILFALAPRYYPWAVRGTGVGAAVAIGRLGSVVGPLYAGALLAGGGGSATVLLGTVPFVVVGGAAALALTWRRPSDD